MISPEVKLRIRRLTGPVSLAVFVGVVTVALHFRDPHKSGSWGYCPWLLLTGTHCPGCGGLRAVNDLTNGRWIDAVSSNALLVAAIPGLVYAWVRKLNRAWRGLPGWGSQKTNRVALIAVGVMLLFTIIRNIPVGSWLAP